MAEGGSHPQEERIVRVTDKLQWDLNSELGRGLWSTVYKGKFEDIPVAVKRIKCKTVQEAQKRIQMFKISRERKIMNIVERERHPNIIGYYVSEVQQDLMYIAMELCDGNLKTYVNSQQLKASYPAKKVNTDIASGVDFLHSRNIAHRDIKPENVYFVTTDGRITRIVIGDFGTSKCTVGDICTMSGSIGTYGYIAAEVWDKVNESDEDSVIIRSQMSTKSDIFALGCVFYFTLTDGLHPFGKNMQLQGNIQNRCPPKIHACCSSDDPLKHLLIDMLSHNPDVRPSASEVMEHPALWSDERTLAFLSDASDELMNHSDSSIRSRVENPDVIRGGNWMRQMPMNMKNYLENYVHESNNGRRVYVYRENNTKVFGLLRAIRNVINHYRQFPPAVVEELGRYPEGHVQFWKQLCPLLLMHVFRKVKDMTLPGLHFHIYRRDIAATRRPPTGPTSEVQPRPEIESMPSFSPYSDASSIAWTDAKQLASPYSEMTSPKVVYKNTDAYPQTMQRLGQETNTTMDTEVLAYHNKNMPSQTFDSMNSETIYVNEEIKRLSLDTEIEPIMNSQSQNIPGMPDVLRQTESRYTPGTSYWIKVAQDELKDAKASGLYNIECKTIVLCIDISESMSKGEAWSQTKQFVEDVLKSSSAFKTLYGRQSNYVSIVTFGHKTEVVQRLSNDFDTILNVFNGITLGGPTPMYGGVNLAEAASLVPERQMAKPTIALITDCKPTETTRFTGPDTADENYMADTNGHLLTGLMEWKNRIDGVFVPVGNFDENFLDLMIGVSDGKRLSYKDGKAWITEIFRSAVGRSGENRYNENKISTLPNIGSRVTRGPDWKWENQDSNGPGTVIGHETDDASVWVQWDENDHQNCYRCGSENCYDILPSDKAREVSGYGTLKVGNIVTLGKDTKGLDKGVVVRIEENGKIHVRWENGDRGDYSFGLDGVYDVWPWVPEKTTTTDQNPTEPPEHQAPLRDQMPTNTPQPPKKGRNKNIHPRQSRHT